jgi:BCD family chlorophyll transporter-like MFS transporter
LRKARESGAMCVEVREKHGVGDARMKRLTEQAIKGWLSLGPRFLPFADAATPELPLSRLLRLSLFQVTVGMALVLLIGTLNRVMIVELSVPASLVGIMISLPLLFAPFRALIGHRSDSHSSALGWRRVPYLIKGTTYQAGGLAVMPFAILVLSGQGQSGSAPAWIGQVAAAFSFLMVGAGLHMVQTVGLALATDLAKPESRPKVVGLMYVMLLAGMIVSALVFGWLLHDFSPLVLIQVIQGTAVVTIVLNVIALWKQEPRQRGREQAALHAPSFREAWDAYVAGRHATRRLVIVGLGTMGFGMADVLLEPFGGEVLHLSVADTTKLTATLAVGGLLGFALASRVLSRGTDPLTMAAFGVCVGVFAFAAVILSAPLYTPALFVVGTLLIGFGAGLFGHGTLTASMNMAPEGQVGLALGAWGAAQATAAGTAIALGGIVRDVMATLPFAKAHDAAMPYLVVYGMEIAFLVLALVVIAPLLGARAAAQREQRAV